MALSLNEFQPNTPLAGMYVYQANLSQLHNVIVSASQSTALKAGAIVAIDSSSTNTNAPVAKQAAVNGSVFGVVTYNPVKSQFAAGERISIARNGDIIWLPAAGAVAAGAILYFNSSNKVKTSGSAGDAVIGRALTPASAADDLIQVELCFASPVSADLSGYLTSADAATTYLAISDAATDYQPKLTAGDFIDITSNTITTTYTAGTGIAISDAGVISASEG